MLGFAHAAIRDAVERRYLSEPAQRDAAHRVLATYFADQPVHDRVADELGWQYAAAGDQAGLRATLSDLEWATAAYARNPFDLRRLWYRLTPDVADELLVAYAPVIAAPADHDDGQLAWGVSRLLADAGATDAAEAAERAGNHAAAKQWGEAGVQLAYQLADVARAERLWTVLTAAAQASDDGGALQRALGEHALLLINRAQANPAAIDLDLLARVGTMLAEQESICRTRREWAGLVQALGNRAIVQRYTGDLTGALASLDEQLQLAGQTGNAQGVLMATANRGEVLGLLGRVPEALDALGSARQTAANYGLSAMVQQLDAMIAGLRPR